MTAAVTDATVLIYLARLGDIDLLDAGFDRVMVPMAVTEEVIDRGLREGYRDAVAVEEATGAFLDVVEPSASVGRRAREIRESAGLGRGESAAIALAERHDARCLTDDHAARTTAAALGVAVSGTIFVLLDGLADGRYRYGAYVDRIDTLADTGFHMSGALYRRAVEAGERVIDEG